MSARRNGSVQSGELDDRQGLEPAVPERGKLRTGWNDLHGHGWKSDELE